MAWSDATPRRKFYRHTDQVAMLSLNCAPRPEHEQFELIHVTSHCSIQNGEIRTFMLRTFHPAAAWFIVGTSHRDSPPRIDTIA